MKNYIFIIIIIIIIVLYETSCVTRQNRLNGEYHHYKFIFTKKLTILFAF